MYLFHLNNNLKISLGIFCEIWKYRGKNFKLITKKIVLYTIQNL